MEKKICHGQTCWSSNRCEIYCKSEYLSLFYNKMAFISESFEMFFQMFINDVFYFDRYTSSQIHNFVCLCFNCETCEQNYSLTACVFVLPKIEESLTMLSFNVIS